MLIGLFPGDVVGALLWRGKTAAFGDSLGGEGRSGGDDGGPGTGNSSPENPRGGVTGEGGSWGGVSPDSLRAKLGGEETGE